MILCQAIDLITLLDGMGRFSVVWVTCVRPDDDHSVHYDPKIGEWSDDE